MKKSISLGVALLFIAGIYAQETPIRDKKEETVTTKLIVNDGKNVEEITVKEETTTEKRDVKLTEKEGHSENLNAEYIPTESKRQVKVNDDVAAVYKNGQRGYYIYNNRKYLFTPDKTGFYISYENGRKQTRHAKIRKTNRPEYFLVTGSGFTGIGYYDDNRNFIIEHLDKTGNNTIIQKYTPLQ